MFSNQIRSHNTKLTLTFLKSNLLIGLLHKNNYHHTRCYNLLKTNFSRFRRIKRQTNSKLTMYCPSCTSCIRGFSLATCSGVAAITWNWLFVSSWTVCVMSPPCTFKVRPLKADAHPPHLKWHSLGVLFLFLYSLPSVQVALHVQWWFKMCRFMQGCAFWGSEWCPKYSFLNCKLNNK